MHYPIEKTENKRNLRSLKALAVSGFCDGPFQIVFALEWQKV